MLRRRLVLAVLALAAAATTACSSPTAPRQECKQEVQGPGKCL